MLGCAQLSLHPFFRGALRAGWSKIMIHIIGKWLLVLAVLLAPVGWAVASENIAIEVALESEFLPVEQAYQLTPRISGNELLLEWQIADGYYLYSHRFKLSQHGGEGDQKVAFDLPSGKVKHDEYFGDVEVFYNQVSLRTALVDSQVFDIKISSQGCADAGLCYPPYHQLFRVNPLNLTVLRINPSAKEDVKDAGASFVDSNLQSQSLATGAQAIEQPQTSLWLMAVMAFLGGLILNLMPCVFPVLALKAISLLESTDTSPTQRRLHGLVYTAGVVASFMAVAGLLMIMRASGQELGWGYQLQSPWFVGALVYLFFLVGLSFSGFVELGAGFAGVGQSLVDKGGLSGSFFTGVLAVVVASPCTAPFMGASLGFAFTQPVPVALTVFLALGLGMAAPFLLISVVPGIGRLLPRPGNWMVTLKEVLAFPMYLTGIWLLWVLGRQAGINGAMLVLVGCLLIAMALYFWSESRWRRVIAVVAGLAAGAILSSSLLIPNVVDSAKEANSASSLANSENTSAYSVEGFSALLDDGGPVFLDVTADWCITCKVNERLVLHTEAVSAVMAEKHIRYVKADWTRRDAQISRLLARYNRAGVPLYVFFPGKGEPEEVLSQILSTEKILGTFNRL